MTKRHPEGVPGPPPRPPDDASLVEGARRGDRSAFEVLFERHRTMLTALVRRAGGPALVEDVVQESALAALIGMDALESPERFGAWLAGIGLNISRRHRRELLNRPSSLDVAVGHRVADGLTLVSPDPGEVAIEREIARSVQAAIGELPRGQREAVALFYLSGLTYRETALALGIEVGAVKARLHKARAHLGKELWSIWKEEEMERTREGAMVKVRASDVLRLAPVEGKPTEFVVMLEEIDGSRRLPIWIKEPEATWLAYGVEQIELPRPGPYSLLASLLDATGASVREVRIERLAEQTYYAVVVAEGKTRAEIDARPSDALNLAVLTGSPIFVTSELLDATAVGSSGYEHLETQLREGATVGAATIGSEARAAWQRTLEELTGEDR